MSDSNGLDLEELEPEILDPEIAEMSLAELEVRTLESAGVKLEGPFERHELYDAWHFLRVHEIFRDAYGGSRFQQCLHVMVVKVDPGTNRIEDERERNTENRIWLECGPWSNPEDFENIFPELDEDELEQLKEDKPLGEAYRHDIDLDCGASTFEEAIVRLANLVYEKYGK